MWETAANIPTDTAKELLEDIWMLNLVKRTGVNVFSWQLSNDMNRLLIESGLGTQNTLSAHRNNNSLCLEGVDCVPEGSPRPTGKIQ